jgi:hypothetical protein
MSRLGAVAIALTLLALAVFVLPAPASASWVPTVISRGEGYEEAAFDNHDLPWVTVVVRYGSREKGGNRWGIGRLLPTGRVAEVRAVPRIPHEAEEEVPRLVIGPSGQGELLFEFVDRDSKSEVGEPFGIAVSSWSPDGIGSPRILARGLTYESGGLPQVAVNAAGTAVVLWSSGDSAVDFARLSGGSLHSIRKVPLAVAPAPGSGSDVKIGEIKNDGAGGTSPAITYGFRAAWIVGSNVETALAGPEGVFGDPLASPWIEANQAPPTSLTEETMFATDGGGDQAIAWSLGSSVYESSRTVGGTFRTPQLIGHGFPPQLEMSEAGRVVVVHKSEPARAVVIATGQAGQPLGSPEIVARAGPGSTISGPAPISTPDDLIITWMVQGTKRQTGVWASVSRDGVHFSLPRKISREPRGVFYCFPHDSLLDRGGGAMILISCHGPGDGGTIEIARFRP